MIFWLKWWTNNINKVIMNNNDIAGKVKVI